MTGLKSSAMRQYRLDRSVQAHNVTLNYILKLLFSILGRLNGAYTLRSYPGDSSSFIHRTSQCPAGEGALIENILSGGWRIIG